MKDERNFLKIKEIMKTPVNIAITGAAGRISYALIYRIAAGELLGPEHPINLYLLEVTSELSVLKGIVMELNDCIFPLLNKVIVTDQPEVAFNQADYVFMLGAKPRVLGMERHDLLQANAEIFVLHGRALGEVASRDVKVLVAGNPSNTNTLIALESAQGLGAKNFTALIYLDFHRAIGLLAEQAGVHPNYVKDIVIWGNHSATQYPDIHHAQIKGSAALDCVDYNWFVEEFIPIVQQRGGAIIEALGHSSVASAAYAAVCQMRDWIVDTRSEGWINMAVLSDGSYGIEPGLIYSYPVRVVNGDVEIVRGLDLSEFSIAKMKETELELKAERDAVKHLLASSD